jgi:hypothetical protein
VSKRWSTGIREALFSFQAQARSGLIGFDPNKIQHEIARTVFATYPVGSGL